MNPVRILTSYNFFRKRFNIIFTLRLAPPQMVSSLQIFRRKLYVIFLILMRATYPTDLTPFLSP